MLPQVSLPGLQFMLLQRHVCVQILQMCLCVFSILSLLQGHFEGVWVLRSEPLSISFSPQQRRGTNGLMDRWLIGLDEGRCGNRGIHHKLKEMAHSQLSRRLPVWVERCTTGLLALQ